MVGGVATAGDPHLARLHQQPAALAGLHGQGGIQAQLACGRTQQLHGTGSG
jgi:hypothetical protein